MEPTSENSPTFDVYRTQDGTVSKYVHEDGSETALKQVLSQQNIVNPLTNQIEPRYSDRNKYSIFVSASAGCYMRCPFCHLTIKNASYRKLTSKQVLANLKEAITDQLKEKPQLADSFVKLSWMGMGDAVNQPNLVRDVSLEIIDWILANKYAKGLDGVDLSTVLPKVSDEWIPVFAGMESMLAHYPRNPVYTMDNLSYTNGAYKQRNLFRLFYSIHSALQPQRDKVVPNALPLDQAITNLKEYESNGANTLILHHMIVQDLNDSEPELEALATLVNDHFETNELRILRYNFCAKSPYKESDTFLRQIRYLSEKIPFLKVQVSPGSEVSAACGQFIVKNFVRNSPNARKPKQA